MPGETNVMLCSTIGFGITIQFNVDVGLSTWTEAIWNIKYSIRVNKT